MNRRQFLLGGVGALAGLALGLPVPADAGEGRHILLEDGSGYLKGLLLEKDQDEALWDMLESSDDDPSVPDDFVFYDPHLPTSGGDEFLLPADEVREAEATPVSVEAPVLGVSDEALKHLYGQLYELRIPWIHGG